MKWSLQVARVARKDLKQVRWILALFLAGITLSVWGIVSGTSFGSLPVAESSGSFASPILYSAFLPTLVSLLGMAVAATLVQLDSPTRPDTFWATRPITPSAVLTAKFLLILSALVAVAVLGAGIAMWALDARSAVVVRTLLPATWTAVQWGLVVTLIAAVTRNLREFVAGMVAIFAILFVAGLLHGDFAIALSRTFMVSASVVSVVSALVFVVRFYRMRERTRVVTAFAYAFATALLASSFIPVANSERSAEPRIIAATTPLRVVAATFVPLDSTTNLLRWILAAPGATDSMRFDFAPDSPTINGPAGEMRVDLPNDMDREPAVLSGAMPWVGRAVNWLGRDSLSMASIATLWSKQEFSAADTARFSGAASSVGGMLTVSRPHILANLPLERGASAVIDGYRVWIYGALHHDSTARMQVQVATVNPTAPGLRAFYGPFGAMALEFVLLNAERGEAVQMTALNSSGTGGHVVMPGVSITATSAEISTGTPFYGRSAIPLDEAWYAGARLVVMRWEPIGKFRVEAEGVVR